MFPGPFLRLCLVIKVYQLTKIIFSGKTARYVWTICLSRIIALQNLPVEDCVLVT